MPELREVVVFEDRFDRPLTLTTTPEGGTGWTVKDTSAVGTPTYTVADGGGLALTLEATSEAQIVTLYHNNIEVFDIDDLQSIEWVAKVSGINSVTTLVMGVADAQNDTADSVANHAWFRMEGSASTANVVVETDDATTDLDDKATGQTLAATFKRMLIDFTYGKSDVRFYMENADGHLARVASGTTFDMDQYSGKLQPFVQIQKASGTGTPAVTLRKFRIQYLAGY